MKKLFASILSVVLCVSMLMSAVSGFTWETPAEGDTLTGKTYYVDFSESVAYLATNGVSYEDKGSYTRFTATGNDPWVHLPLPTCASNQMKYMVVVYKTSVTGAQAKFSLYTAYSGVSVTEASNSLVKRSYEAVDKWDAMILDMTDTAGSHTYTTLRMDMLDLSTAGQYVDIKALVGFATYEEAVAYEANHDNWDMMDDKYTLDFSDDVSMYHVTQVTATCVDGKFTRFTATNTDPYVFLPKPDAASTAMDYAVILYRTTAAGARGEFYFRYTNTSGVEVNMGNDNSNVSWAWGNTTGEWATQIVNMTAISKQCGSNAYSEFRLDPLANISAGATIDIASITCFSSKAKATAYADSLEGFSTLTPNYQVDLSDVYTTFQNESNMSHTFVNGQYIRMTSSTADPNIWLPTPMCDSKDMRYVVLVYRTNATSQGEFYVSRSDGAGMSQSTRVGWTWGNTTGTWATQVIDLNAICVDDVSFTAFRIDPLTVAGKTIDLRMVAGFATAEDANAYAALYEGYATLDPSYEADFSQSMDFTHQNQTSVLFVDNKFARLTATGSDPYIGLPVPAALCRDMKYAVIVYRTEVAGASGDMFVSRTDGAGWGDSTHLTWAWEDTSGAWDAMVLDVSSIMGTDVNTNLQTLRVDTLAGATSGQWIDFRTVAMFETKEAAEAYAATFADLRTTEPNYMMDGADASNSSRLSNGNGVTCTFTDDEYLHIVCSTTDPYFHLPTPTTAGKQLNYLTIFYRLSSGGSGEVFSVYDGSYRRVGFNWPATSGDGWGKVVVDISSISGGDAYYSVLRLDPLTTTGSIDIRMIAGFATYQDATAFELTDYVWSETVYTEQGSVALDSDAGTLSYTYNNDDTVTISYTVNSTVYSYTVPNDHNYLSGGYAGTDDLGRELPNAQDVGVYGDNGEHYVGLFYFLWMGLHGDSGVYDLQDILDTYGQEGAKDLSHYGGVGVMHWFSEPLYGYYYANDIWVMRKHMELLSNANIDFLYIDITNGIDANYVNSLKQLMSVSAELRNQGYDAPQIVAYTNTAAEGVVQALYDYIYKQNWCPESWFCIDGKPVIVAPYSANIDDFFTIKQNQWPNDSTYKSDGWPWMDFQWPQRIFTASTSVTGDASAINVSIAQHSGNTIFSSSSIYNWSSDSGNRGRSYDGTQSVAATMAAVNNNPDLTKYGLNFQAQWDRAIAANVPFVLVTGWNEWVAQLQDKSVTGYDVGFVDTASEEYSRDAEMLRGGYFDNYYMQLIANVTKLKGAAPIVVQDARNPINVTGDFSQWDSVIVDYNDPSGDMQDRHGQAFGNTYNNDTTGRNDIVNAKVTSDTEYVYFYVETAADISMYNTDASWMQLFVNTDRNATNGWYGYDYIINYNAKSQNVTTVAKCSTVDGSFGFTEIGEVSYQVSGNQMMIAVPQELIGIDGYKEIYIEFKWADADVQIDEMEDFYCYGDAAPLGRLNNIYQNYIPGVSQISYDTYTADDSELEAAINEFATVDATLYTAETYAAYETAVSVGTYYVDNPNATQAEVDAAAARIIAAKNGLTVPTTVDTSALKAAVEEASTVEGGNYASDSYAAYMAAVAAGESILADGNATQAAVDAATEAILIAKAGLTTDRSVLQAVVNEASSITAGIYSESTYAAYTEAVAAGETVLADATATQTAIDAATAAINAAKAALATDKSALQAAVDDAANVTEGTYSESTYAAYTEAVAAGQTILADATATQTAIEAATEAINAAKAALTTDKSALQAAVDDAASITEGTYSESTYAAYTEAVAAGQTVLADATATQTAIDAAVQAINTAKAGLTTDTSALQRAVDDFATVDGSLYTEATYAAYEAAVTAGQAVLDDADATQTAVNAALEAILAALEGLELIPTEVERVEGMTSAGFQTTYVYEDATARLTVITLRDSDLVGVAIFDADGNQVEYVSITEAAYNRRKPTQRIFYVDLYAGDVGTQTFTVYGVDANGNLTSDFCTCSIEVKSV